MRDFKNQIKPSERLVDLLDYMEVNCSAACCGYDAFEINRALLLRKLLDLNVDRVDWHIKMSLEVGNLYREIQLLGIDDPEEDIPVVYPRNESLPEYYLPHNELLHLFKRLKIVLNQVVGSNVLPEYD